MTTESQLHNHLVELLRRAELSDVHFGGTRRFLGYERPACLLLAILRQSPRLIYKL